MEIRKFELSLCCFSLFFFSHSLSLFHTGLPLPPPSLPLSFTHRRGPWPQRDRAQFCSRGTARWSRPLRSRRTRTLCGRTTLRRPLRRRCTSTRPAAAARSSSPKRERPTVRRQIERDGVREREKGRRKRPSRFQASKLVHTQRPARRDTHTHTAHTHTHTCPCRPALGQRRARETAGARGRRGDGVGQGQRFHNASLHPYSLPHFAVLSLLSLLCSARDLCGSPSLTHVLSTAQNRSSPSPAAPQPHSFLSPSTRVCQFWCGLGQTRLAASAAFPPPARAPLLCARLINPLAALDAACGRRWLVRARARSARPLPPAVFLQPPHAILGLRWLL